MSAFSNLTDVTTNRSARIDAERSMQTATLKRIIGSMFGSSLDTSQYTSTVAGTGACNVAGAVASLATGATANSTSKLVSIASARNLAGRSNLFRGNFRFSNTGSANNLREFGLQADASNQFNFRLNGTTFSVVMKRQGSETVVASGSFNGNGTGASGTYTVDTNFHTFEILYIASSVRFLIDNVAIHTFSPTTTALTDSLVGVLYANNANSGGGTANVTLDILNWSVSFVGDAINVPRFYFNNAVAETRTLKSGGGTIQSVTIGRIGGVGATLTIYDNTAGSGTIIALFDLTTANALGTHTIGIEGANFYTGLTYVTSGTLTNAAFTIFWD